MVTIESTEMATKVYETMAHNLRIVRRRLGRPLTLADKVLLGHLDDPEHQDMEPGTSYLQLRPDRVVLQDVLGQTAMLQFMQTCATPSPCPRPSTVTISFKRGSKARQICAPRSRKIRKSMPSCGPQPPSTARVSGRQVPASFIRWCSSNTLSLR